MNKKDYTIILLYKDEVLSPVLVINLSHVSKYTKYKKRGWQILPIQHNSTSWNKNRDIKFSAHDAFLE